MLESVQSQTSTEKAGVGILGAKSCQRYQILVGFDNESARAKVV